MKVPIVRASQGQSGHSVNQFDPLVMPRRRFTRTGSFVYPCTKEENVLSLSDSFTTFLRFRSRP
jgi:hypothetical protein